MEKPHSEHEKAHFVDANGRDVWLSRKNTALIVDAVNERDRLRDIVRNAVETLEQVYKHADMTDYLRADVAEMQREAIAALGEGETPTGKGVER
jgi:hypothetical protein